MHTSVNSVFAKLTSGRNVPATEAVNGCLLIWNFKSSLHTIVLAYTSPNVSIHTVIIISFLLFCEAVYRIEPATRKD